VTAARGPAGRGARARASRCGPAAFRTVTAFLLLAGALGACGQRGPLYLPGSEDDPEVRARVTAPAGSGGAPEGVAPADEAVPAQPADDESARDAARDGRRRDNDRR
jgi:predicted small lipoprotein YifL